MNRGNHLMHITNLEDSKSQTFLLNNSRLFYKYDTVNRTVFLVYYNNTCHLKVLIQVVPPKPIIEQNHHYQTS